MSAALNERIAAAFTEGTRSTDIVSLIGETEAASVASGDAAEAARTRALDPALSAADVAAARRDMEDAAFRRDRMREAAHRLAERFRKVKAQEENERRQLIYDAAMAERDKLAAELAAVYPNIAEQLADLAARIAANDAVVERVNRKSLPDGAAGLASAEAIARHLRGFVAGTSYVPRISQQLRLPAFLYSGNAPYTWPRAEGQPPANRCGG